MHPISIRIICTSQTTHPHTILYGETRNVSVSAMSWTQCAVSEHVISDFSQLQFNHLIRRRLSSNRQRKQQKATDSQNKQTRPFSCIMFTGVLMLQCDVRRSGNTFYQHITHKSDFFVENTRKKFPTRDVKYCKFSDDKNSKLQRADTNLVLQQKNLDIFWPLRVWNYWENFITFAD